jgi:hypothetical protein
MFLYDFSAVTQLPEDDQEISKHVEVVTNCIYKYNFNINTSVALVVQIGESYINQSINQLIN